VHVEVFLGERSVTARVTDEGAGFDPRDVPDPTVPANLCKDSGRGLFLMRELMDEVRYNARGNSVTLILHLPLPQNGSKSSKGASKGASA
jgi:anti-sigma regulatory factor (Ser/Thr protein kinase)